MTLHERSLSVLACRHVDEVIIGAPPALTEDLITTFNISIVARGSVSEMSQQTAPAIDRCEASAILLIDALQCVKLKS